MLNAPCGLDFLSRRDRIELCMCGGSIYQLNPMSPYREVRPRDQHLERFLQVDKKVPPPPAGPLLANFTTPPSAPATP